MASFAPPAGGGAALVTGAAQGIGLALATALTQDGWRVTLADLDAAGAGAAAARLPGATGIGLDVTDPDAVDAAVAAVEEREPLRVMVNNAGVAPAPGDDGLFPVAEWRRVVAVNLMGVVHGVNAAYPRMRARGSGVILNVASLAGLVPGPAMGPYGATKHAVVGLSTGLRTDAAPFGVRVSALCPGWVDTPMLDGEGPDGRPIKDDLTSFGIGAPADPADIARTALDGLRRNRALIVAPAGARRAWVLNRLVPALVEQQSIRMARRLAGRAAARAGR